MDTSRVTGTLGFRLRNAHLRVQKQFASEFEGAGVTPLTYSVLLLIADNPNCRQVELAEAMRVQQTNLVSWLDALSERGWISRVPDAQDGRVNLISLTEAGARLMPELEARARLFRKAIVDHLGDQRTEALSETLNVLCDWD